MNLNKDRLKITYDTEADVLDITRGKSENTDYVEYTDDVISLFHPETTRRVHAY